MNPIRFVFRERNELKFNRKEAKEILNSVGERPLVIYAIVGLPNTGKSYLLNWFAVYLDKLSKLLANLPENVSTIDDLNNLISGIDFLKQSEYVQRFKCNEGASGGTTGVFLSQPFILSIPEIVNNTIQPNKKEVAVLLLDAEGHQDFLNEGRDPEQDQRLFILTTLMSSVLIINDASGNRFLHDKTYEYFDCVNGYGAYDPKCSNQDESRNKPFQKLVFLKRNWDDTDSYDYGFHNNHVPEDKNIFKAQLTPTNVQSESVSRLLKIIHECFSDVSAFLLANPGPNLRREKTIDETYYKFKEYFKKFICEMLAIERADGIILKEIDRCEVTGVKLISYVERWINMLDQKQEKGLAEVISRGTAEVKCRYAKNNAVNHYHLEMHNTVMFSDPPVSEELFNIEHKKFLEQCSNIFNQEMCPFWFDIVQHYLQEMQSEIDRLMDLFSLINCSLHKHAKEQLAIVRASQEFLSNPIKGTFTYEIIKLYHQATVWAYEGEYERADECYEQIKMWSMESRDLRVDSFEQVDELAVNSDKNIYQMRQLPRGYCVIINNEHFESFSTRNGSQADVTGLAMVFRNLGFIISIHENLTKKDMRLRLHEISQEESLCNHDAIVIAILSHGDNDFIYGSDAKGIKHYDIFNMFSTSHCPQLRGKPKIFLNQFCRGHSAFSGSIRVLRNSDTGDGVADTHALRTDSKASSLSLNTDAMEDENGNDLPLTDAVIWYSTLKNYVSYRNINTGSYFIQAFIKVMEKATPKQDFISIAQEVNLEVQERWGEQATELKLIGWPRKLYLKTIDADKKEETKKIHVNPSFFETTLNENMEVILVEDESLLEKMNDKNNILETTEEDGIRLKMFRKPSFDSVISSDKNDLMKQYHILLYLEDNESNQTFRMHSSNSKRQIDDIFKSYSKHFIPFTRYYIDKIGNGKINAYQLENIFQYITEFPDHSLIHFAAAFGCTRYFDEQQTNASSSNSSIAQYLVNENAENTHMTPIHAALVSRYNMHNKKIVVEKLLALRADLSARDKYGNTVLHFSANTNKEIVGILLSDHGIRQLSPKQDLCNCNNEQPHDLAAYFGNIEVYQLLFEFYKQNETDSDFQSNFQITENIDTDSSSCSKIAKILQNMRFKPHASRKEGISLFFHLNLKFGIYPSLKNGKELIIEGVNVNAPNPEGETPLLQICANKEIKEKYHKLKWILLFLTANAETDVKNKDDNTALHYLVSLDDRMGVKALLVYGADPSICNNSKRTPYWLATNEKMEELLKQIGLDVINDKATLAKEPLSSNPESVETTITDITPSSSTTNLIPSSSKLPCKVGNATGSKVLCLDGGGIKGLNSLVILDQIEKMTKKSIVESFDWIVGTSSGGIIALALAAGRTVRQCKNLYFKLKDKIFGNVKDKITGDNSARLEKILQAEFLEMKMSDLKESKIKVAITTTVSINKHPRLVVYPNYVIEGWNKDYEFKDEFVWKVGRMTSAAPWYFKPVGNSFDGGLLANNPTLDALVQVSKYNKVVQKSDQERASPVVVSVGTGSWLKENKNDRKSKKSRARRTLEVVNLLINSTTNTDGNVVDQAIAAVNNGSYIRIQPLFKNNLKMDETNTKKLLNMMWETKVFMYQNREQINEFMNILK